MKNRCPIFYKKKSYFTQRLAEKAMLSIYQDKYYKIFGSYKCPFCLYWHLTSQYDNRSPQSLHEFRNYIRSQKSNKRKAKQITLSQNEMKDAMAKLQEVKRKQTFLYKITKVWKSLFP